MQNLILGSSSSSRKQQLQQLGLPFQVITPNIREERLSNETPAAMVERLAIAKAHAIAKQTTNSLIISCDQTICLENEIFGKPLDHQKAVQQLQKMSGKKITSLTAICLLNTNTLNLQIAIEPYEVYFRTMNITMIENYLHHDQPYHCAGSIKAEKLGVALFERMAGDDPNALLGLPLIRLIRFLENEGVDVLAA